MIFSCGVKYYLLPSETHMSEGNKERLSMTMTPSVIRRLDRAAKSVGMSRSALVEALCLKGLGEVESRAHAMKDPLMARLLEVLTSPESVERAARIVGEEATDPSLFRRRAVELLATTKGAK